MSTLRKILLGDGGPGAALGTALLFGFGLVLIITGAIDLGESFRSEPLAFSCAAFLRAPSQQWFAVADCRLDLRSGHLEPGVDGGAPARWAALTPPAGALDGGARVLLSIDDPALLALAEQLERLSPAESDAALQSAPDVVKASLRPERLAGHLEPRFDGWVLARGKPAPPGRSLLAFFLGTALLAWAFGPVAIRWLLHRERGGG